MDFLSGGGRNKFIMTARYFSLFLLILFVVLYVLPLPVRPLFVQDETRYAEVPREMISTGNWVVPKINGLRYFEKPVMGYWLIGISLTIFGENNFGVRFVSALSTGLVALLLFSLCSNCSEPDSRLPWLSVLVYLTSLGTASIGTFAVLDTSFTLFVSAALVCFFLSTEERLRPGRERILLFSAGIFTGCAFLTKGFLAFALPVLALGPYLLCSGRLRQVLRFFGWPVAGIVLVSLPWSLLIHHLEPDFWDYFFWNEHVRRFFSDSAQHRQPFWYFAAVLPVMLLPWTFLLPAVIPGLRQKKWRNKKEYRLFVFCCCWFLFPFFFFSASSGKLVTYIHPCVPPVAILCAMGLNRILVKEKATNIQQGTGAAMVITLLALLAIAGLQAYGFDRSHFFQRSWTWIAFCCGLTVMLFLLGAAITNKHILRKVILFALSFSVLLFVAQFTMPRFTLNMKAPGPLILRNAASVDNQTYVLSGEEAVRAVCWYLKRDDVYLVERAGELQYGLNFPGNNLRLLSPADAGSLMRKHPGQVVLVISQKEYNRLLPVLPQPVSMDFSGDNGFLFLRY